MSGTGLSYSHPAYESPLSKYQDSTQHPYSPNVMYPIPSNAPLTVFRQQQRRSTEVAARQVLTLLSKHEAFLRCLEQSCRGRAVVHETFLPCLDQSCRGRAAVHEAFLPCLDQSCRGRAAVQVQALSCAAGWQGVGVL